MTSLLPPGIPHVRADDIRRELVAHIHGEQTVQPREVIEYYLEHDESLKADHASLLKLTQILKHTPSIQPSRQFVRRMARALPRLRSEGQMTKRMEELIASARWTLEDRFLFLFEYARYALRYRPAPFLLATFGVTALVLALVSLPAMFLLPESQRPDFLPELTASSASDAADTDLLTGRLPKPPWRGPRDRVDRDENGAGPDDVNPPPPTGMNNGAGDRRGGGAAAVDGRPPREVGPLDVPAPPIDGVSPSDLTGMIVRPRPRQVLGWYEERIAPNRVEKRGEEEHALIERALDWLVAHQLQDGAWNAESPTSNADDPPPQVEATRPFITDRITDDDGETREIVLDSTTIELTGLATLALLANGIGSYSAEPDRPRGVRGREWREEGLPRFKRQQEAVHRAIRFLIKQQDKDSGRIGGAREADVVMAHAIATLALIEDFAVGGNYLARRHVSTALEFLLGAQNEDGFWGYRPRDGDSQLTPTFWAVMALRSAAYTGATALTLEDDLFENTRVLLRRMTLPPVDLIEPGGVVIVAETPSGIFPDAPYRPTAIGMVLTEMLEVPAIEQSGQPEDLDRLRLVLDGELRFLDHNPPRWEHDREHPGRTHIDYYYWYYGALAMANLAPAMDPADERAAQWRTALLETLTEHQVQERGDDPEEGGAERELDVGALPAAGGLWQRGRVLSTSLALLALLARDSLRWQ